MVENDTSTEPGGDVDRQGRKVGAWVEADPHGGRMSGTYREGEKDGLWERWDPQGRPLDRGEFDRGTKSGEWTVLNPDGTVRRVTRHRGRPRATDAT